MTVPELTALIQQHERRERELATALRAQLPAVYGLLLDGVESHREKARAELWRALHAVTDAERIPPIPTGQKPPA